MSDSPQVLMKRTSGQVPTVGYPFARGEEEKALRNAEDQGKARMGLHPANQNVVGGHSPLPRANMIPL